MPTPQPTPLPTPIPAGLTVDPVNGPYTTIQAAYNVAPAGATIFVKNGSYPALSMNKAVKLIAHPESVVQPKIAGITVQDNVKNWLIQGFDITGAAVDGIKVYSAPGEVLNSWIHGNKSQGILIVDASDIRIEGNTIEYNGLTPSACMVGNSNPKKHCHEIYMSNYRGLGGPDRIIIKNNILRGASGRGIQWNGDNTGTGVKMTDSIIEGNTIEKCSWGMVLWANADNNIIRNNSISTIGYPSTEDTTHPCIGFYYSNGNQILNNSCRSSTKGSLGGGIGENYGGSTNTFSGNSFSN